MKIFLDTNILLDLLLEREKFEEAMIILNSVERGIHEAVILDITLVNVDYIAKKQKVDAKEFLKLIVKNCKITSVSNDLSLEALALDNNDFEDSLQYVCAKNEACEQIVTNDKGFYVGDVEVVSSVAFVEEFL